MTASLDSNDYILISAYLDGELTVDQLAAVEKRLQTDDDLKLAAQELKYAKHLLASMPKVRAPRNFVLSPERVKKTARRQWFQPAWGMVSAFSTLMLLLVFATTRVNFSLGARSAAPAMEIAAENSAAADSATTDAKPTPMIIFWNPVRGMGGSGGGNDTTFTTKAGELGEAPSVAAEAPQITTEAPQATAPAPSAGLDPSTLILGVPDAETQGKMLNDESAQAAQKPSALPVSTWLMLASGLIALVSAAIAILTRRR